MTQKSQSKLPEGAKELELGPYTPSVELGVEAAELGASEEAVRALGGDEAVEVVRRKREAQDAESANGDESRKEAPSEEHVTSAG
jgi:hypothetical protein